MWGSIMVNNCDRFFQIISFAKNMDFSIDSSQSEKVAIAKKIYDFIISVDEQYSDVLTDLSNSIVRFSDYYDSNLTSADSIIDKFCIDYVGEDVDKVCELFVLYLLFRNSKDFIINYDVFDNLDELFECLDVGNYFDIMSDLIDFMEDKRKKREDEYERKLDFLKDNNKFKILFSGHACDDIVELEPKTLKSFLGKLNTQFCCLDVIPSSEDIGHTKDLYDFQLSRIRLGDSHRIAYTRRKNVTIILGVTKKTGRDLDYTRYDSVASHANQIYYDADLFSQGMLPGNNPHFNIVGYLQEFSNNMDKTV